MPWTAEVQLDKDKTNVGTATAIWRDAEGNELFRYARRAKVEAQDAAAFVTEARNALAAANQQTQRQATLAATLAGLLNA